MIYEKNGSIRIEGYAVQKQAHFSRRLFATKNTNFICKSNQDTYVFSHLPFQNGIDASVVSIFMTDTSDCRPKFIYKLII